MNILDNYKHIKTDDGSFTLYSKEFDESCHSLSGAKEETLKHYVEGCRTLELAHEFAPLNILEVGFGTGIGLLTTINAFKGLSHQVHFSSFEIDPVLVEYFFTENNIPFEVSKDHSLYSANIEHFKISIYVGDARKTIQNIKDIQFHCIYQDAFSPKKNPTLWTVEWFKSLKKISHAKCILSTYSSSSSIRKSLIAAGWIVFDGIKFGKKRSSTRAVLSGSTPKHILEHLAKSPVMTITDNNIEQYLKE